MSGRETNVADTIETEHGTYHHESYLRMANATAQRRGERIAALEAVIVQLAVALQGHRADMHHPSDRPCPTCGPSAKALRAVGVEPFYEHAGMDREAARASAERAAVASPSNISEAEAAMNGVVGPEGSAS